MYSSNKQLSSITLMLLWFGASVSIAEILTGGILAPMGFSAAMGGIIIGHIIGAVILALGAIIGAQSKLPAIKSTQISFGAYGAKLFAFLNILQLIGWTSIMILTGGRAANEIAKILYGVDNISLWSLGIGLAIILWIYMGKKGFTIINSIAVILLLLLTLVLASVVFSHSAEILSAPSSKGISTGLAMELSVIMPLSWLPLIADYTRYAKDSKKGVLGSFLGYLIGSTLMYTIGLAAAIYSGSADPATMMIAADLGLFALGIVVLSTITTTFMDAYSAGVSALNILPKASEKNIAIIMAIIGVVLALWVPMEQYEHFLYAIGSVFGPLFAIVLTDYFIFKNKTLSDSLICQIGSFIIWAIGVFMYYQIKELDLWLGVSIPVMLFTSVLFIISKKFIKKWEIRD